MVFTILLAGFAIGVVVDWATPGQAWLDMADAGDEEIPVPLAPEEGTPEQLAIEGRWAQLWWTIPASMVRGWRHAGPTALAALTGLCWATFLIHALYPRSLRDGRLWVCVAAVGLGVLSVWPTLFLIYWQEHGWGLEESAELAPGIRYFVLGVGLREEVAKFVCLLPLLPYLVRRRDELAALIAAGCVGVGFAMEENVNYFHAEAGLSTVGRLLSAAPLHMSLTGIVGLAAYRACLWPKEWAPQCLALLGVVALAHGLYDSFLALPALADYALAGPLIFILAVYQFFRELRMRRTVRGEPVSLTATFLFGVSTVAAATFVYMSALVGWQLAADALVVGIISQAIMVYLFLREMPETMVSV